MFKSEKFYKEIIKTENQEILTDSVNISTLYGDIAINSLKKEYGEFFQSVLIVRGILE